MGRTTAVLHQGQARKGLLRVSQRERKVTADRLLEMIIAAIPPTLVALGSWRAARRSVKETRAGNMKTDSVNAKVTSVNAKVTSITGRVEEVHEIVNSQRLASIPPALEAMKADIDLLKTEVRAQSLQIIALKQVVDKSPLPQLPPPL